MDFIVLVHFKGVIGSLEQLTRQLTVWIRWAFFHSHWPEHLWSHYVVVWYSRFTFYTYGLCAAVARTRNDTGPGVENCFAKNRSLRFL